MVFTSTVWKMLKKAIAELNIHRQNFCNSSKICQNHETLLFMVVYHFVHNCVPTSVVLVPQITFSSSLVLDFSKVLVLILPNCQNFSSSTP